LKFATKTSRLSAETRRWKTDNASSGEKDPKKDIKDEEVELFATDVPKTREEVIRQAETFKKLYQEIEDTVNRKHESLVNKEDSVFSQFRKPRTDGNDVTGMTPSAASFASADSLRNAQDIKIRRNTILRRTLLYTLGEMSWDARSIRYALAERKLLVLYAIFTAGLLGFAYFSSSPEYDFFGRQEFEEEQRRKRAAMAQAQNNGDHAASGFSGLVSNAWDSVVEFGSNFSLLEPFKKIAYLVGGSIVSLRMLHSFWKGDPLSDDERLIVAHTPVSLAEDLRPDEFHHVNPLLRIMATGHIPVGPWTAVIPPSPWAPHLTVVIETDLLYSIGFNAKGERVMRKRPFADYFLASVGENAEIILSSAHHSKASAKHFFKLFDPYGVASYTFTAEDHRWDGLDWLKPLEERYIGRKPERLLVLDSDHRHCGSMCKNVLRIKPWQGNDTDTTFLDLTPLVKYMAAGVEEGFDTRSVISKYEGNSSAKDVIREQIALSGLEVPKDDPLERRLREKYGRDQEQEQVLTDSEFSASMDRVLDHRNIQPRPVHI
jgi:hypothetical protein